MWHRFSHRSFMNKIGSATDHIMVASFGFLVGMGPGILIGELAERKKLKN